MPDNTSEFLFSILSDWYKYLLHEIYVKNENIVFSSSKANKQRNSVARDFERLEENLKTFILHMHEKY